MHWRQTTTRACSSRSANENTIWRRCPFAEKNSSPSRLSQNMILTNKTLSASGSRGRYYGNRNGHYSSRRSSGAKRAALAANPGAELVRWRWAAGSMASAWRRSLARAAAIRRTELTPTTAPPSAEAAARWMKNVCGVGGLDPRRNPAFHWQQGGVVDSAGLLHQPGDVALMTTPGYPVFARTRKLGGQVYNLPLLEKNNFCPICRPYRQRLYDAPRRW